jgi:hypothetical protein
MFFFPREGSNFRFINNNNNNNNNNKNDNKLNKMLATKLSCQVGAFLHCFRQVPGSIVSPETGCLD